MRKNLLPWYLQNLNIRGFEGEDEETDESSTETETEGGEGDSGDKDSGNDGLKSALRKERQERKKLERELRVFQSAKQKADESEQSEATKAKEAAEAARLKAEKLAVKFAETAVNTAIMQASTKLKVRDLDAVIKLLNRGDIDVDQDDEDPSDVKVDSKSVEDAVKALLKDKPYLVQEGSSGEKSGSKFNGGQKSQEQLDEEALKAKYPALRFGNAK